MAHSSRREFLHAGAGTASALLVSGSSRAAAPNDEIVLGIIGCGGQGGRLATSFSKRARIAYVCDPDESRRGRLKESVGAAHAVEDLRRVLDDKSVDAVVVAAPDHWHAPAAILACDAGKHVYVEKPQSHNLRESRLLLNAARKHNRVVQHGTQNRSAPYITDAIKRVHEGEIGEVLVAKAWNVQLRQDIGKQQPSKPPTGVDYDMWVGPAEFQPFQANRFHYNWHWWHNFGTGDIGNDGTHEIDYARWGLGVSGLPTTVTGSGGKYFFDDDQQFPDTATCTFEWPGNADAEDARPRQLIFEMRLWSKNYPFNCDTGAEFYGTKGRMLLSKRGKLEVYSDKNQRVFAAKPDKGALSIAHHHDNFLSAIRNGSTPNADVGIGHDSVSLVHLANLAVRVNRSLTVDPAQERIVNDDAANALLSRRYRDKGHWAIPKV